ncbi:MAG: histidinol-phosphate transaminase [Pseudomonadota bacterium]
MPITSRRQLLLGGSMGLTLGACATQTSGVQSPSVSRLAPQSDAAGFLGPAPGIAKLNSNENPYGPSDSARAMMKYAAEKGAYYADHKVNHLAELIAERHGLAVENISISAGSAEALSAIAVIFGQKGPIIAPRLSFDETLNYAQRLGLAEVQHSPMAADLSIDLAVLEAMVSPQTGMVQICNPNNPTGILTDANTLKAAVRRMAQKTTVIVDEAYMELTDDPEGNTCVDLIKQGHDVIVARTFSKLYGMAGIRVGYTISSPETAQKIQSGIMSWISGVGIAAAVGCYNDTAFVQDSRSKLVQGREMVMQTLDTLGLEALPSQASFVFFRSGKDANALQGAMAERDILIRGQYLDYAQWSRVSMGYLEDVERFCKTLPELLAS